ncbi:glycosyltransferase [Catalinimonas sp. 4WD22]|uniref:glycosyltransferase n=1 Tax=Catalinimonas locisalis TaxID=3133978 RepID=UPI0031018B52
MRLLRVIPSMYPSSGGPCQGIRNSIPEMKKLGVENEVVCLDDINADYQRQDSFLIHPLGESNNPWAYNKHLVSWLTLHLINFDVVIIHGLWQYHSYAVRKAIRSLVSKSTNRIPKVFVMPHGMLDPYFQKAPDRKLKAARNWIYWNLIEGKVINEADGLLFTCEEELKLARKTFQFYFPKREINVGYGISSPPPFAPNMTKAFKENCPNLEEKPYLLFLSRIHEKKGIELLLKAYSKITRGCLYNTSQDNDEFPQLVIAGPGLETLYGKKIKNMALNDPNLQRNVHFTGMLTGDAKWGAFYGCEAFVLPSHQENFGIAVVEALACAKPVLISNQVNIWREIQEAEGGMVANDTLDGIYELLKSWKNLKKEIRLRMEKNAKKTFEKHFASGPAAHKLLNAISSK